MTGRSEESKKGFISREIPNMKSFNHGLRSKVIFDMEHLPDLFGSLTLQHISDSLAANIKHFQMR